MANSKAGRGRSFPVEDSTRYTKTRADVALMVPPLGIVAVSMCNVIVSSVENRYRVV